MARRRRLTQELDELGDVIRLRDDFGAEFRKGQDQLLLAESTITKSRAALEEIDTQLAQLDPPRMLLDAANEIESLQERLGVVEKASVDRVALENWQQDCEHQARRILRELGRTIDLDEAETLRLRVDEPAIIRRLGQRFAELRVQAEEARKTIARHEDQIKRQEKEQADLEPPRDVEPLRRAVKQARKAGDLDAGLADARGKLARAEKKAATALARLPGWSRSAEELQRLAVPLNATLDQFESQLQETARQRKSLTERMAAEDESIRQLETRLQTLELQQDVPTEEVLLAARKRREHGWRLVKAAWLDSAPDGEAVAAFLVEFAPEGTLASAYEQSVQRGDAMADRLRREADRVAHKAESLAQLNRHRTTREGLEREGQLLNDRQASIDREWNALVGPLGIDDQARTPAELRAWLRQREEVVQLLEKVEEHRQSLEPLEQTFNKQRAAMSRAMDEVGEPLSTTDSDLAEMLEKAEALIKRHDDLSQRRAKLETKLATAQAERATAELSLQTAEVELTGWRTEWSVMMARIGLEAEALPEQAEVFLTKISELLEKLTDRRGHQSRIHGIDRDADVFTRDVAALVARVAPDWADRSSAEQARELARRLRAAQADAQKCTTLTQQRQREQGNLDAAETNREQARVCLERLCKEAGCADFDDLPEAERRSQNLARLEADRTACEEQLMVAAAGADLTAFATEAEQADPDSLDAMIEEFEVKIAAQEEELRRLDQTIGAERGELDRMDGSDRAAEYRRKIADAAGPASRRRRAVCDPQTGVGRDEPRHRTVSREKPGADPGAGRRAVRRHDRRLVRPAPDRRRRRRPFGAQRGPARRQARERRKHERRLPRPALPRLAAGKPGILAPVPRADSRSWWTTSCSTSTMVAPPLRLAALVELSHRTQVLFFTHHRHIIDLANAHLPREDVFVHELPGPRTRDSSTNSQVRLGEVAAK